MPNRAASVALIAASAAALLALGARRTSAGAVESGDELGAFAVDALADRAERIVNLITERPAGVDADTAARNLAAFLAVIRHAEGTEGRGDPYRVCYGYRHTVRDLGEHPAISGEWTGERLPDAMCQRAGFSAGCVSTAAGAYQLIRPTWARVRDALGLRDFGAESQDRAAIELIRSRGALGDAQAGRLADAVRKCRNEWASLPGNYAGQGQRDMATLAAWFNTEGGNLA